MKFLTGRYLSLYCAVGAVMALGFASVASAEPYDLSGATDGVVAQVTDVLTSVLPIAGGIIALFVGWKILRRMVKA